MIYIAGPMFSEAELTYNLTVAAAFEEKGFTVFLPQRDGLNMKELLQTMDIVSASRLIFRKDAENVQKADAFVYILDGRVPDEGAAVALGLAMAHGVKCYGIKTDPRVAMPAGDNAMITGSLEEIFPDKYTAAESLSRLYGI